MAGRAKSGRQPYLTASRTRRVVVAKNTNSWIAVGPRRLSKQQFHLPTHQMGMCRAAEELDWPLVRPMSSVQLNECIASGTYGEAWKCRVGFTGSDLASGETGDSIDRDMCIKLISVKTSLGCVAPIELDVLCRLRHRNLMPGLGLKGINRNSADPESTLGIVMPLCVSPILDYVRNFAPSTAQKVLFLCDMATGMKYLHDSGIIHNDTKLDNVLVYCPTPSAPRAVLADFGLSVYHQGRGCKTLDSMLISDHYRPPELAARAQQYRYTTASDVWALGCVFLFVMAGRKTVLRPYETKEVADKLARADVRRRFMREVLAERLTSSSSSNSGRKCAPAAIDSLADILSGMLDPRPTTRMSLPAVLSRLETITGSPSCTPTLVGMSIPVAYYHLDDVPKPARQVGACTSIDVMFRLMHRLDSSAEAVFLAGDLFNRSVPIFPDAVQAADLNLIAVVCAWIAVKSLSEMFIAADALADAARSLSRTSGVCEFDRESLVRMERMLLEVLSGIVYPPNLYTRHRTSSRDLVRAFEILRNHRSYVDTMNQRENQKSPAQPAIDASLMSFRSLYAGTLYSKRIRAGTTIREIFADDQSSAAQHS